MGCGPSKPIHPPSRDPDTSFLHYTGPKEFRASVMTERRLLRHATQEYQPYRPPPEQKPRSHRQAAHMYQTYRQLDQQRDIKEGRRYSWEGHSSERTFTTFESLAERGVISKNALKKK